MHFHIDNLACMESFEEIKRCCSFCGKELTGRSDKKFCDDICRNNHAYQHARVENEVINKINKSLLYNRKVLRSITKRGRKIVKKQLLVDKDFNFDVITGLYKTHRHREYMLLYDYAYRCINDEDVVVLKCYK